MTLGGQSVHTMLTDDLKAFILLEKLMKTLLLTTARGKIEKKAVDELDTLKPRGWDLTVMQPGPWKIVGTPPSITVVRLNNKTKPAQVTAMIPRLAELQSAYSQGSYVVFTCIHPRKAKDIDVSAYAAVNRSLKQFPYPERVEISEWSNMYHVCRLIAAKLDIAPPRSSPLDDVEEVQEKSRDMRTSKGNISAELISGLFGITLSKLAGWLGRHRQTVIKTPDADSLQPALQYFEKIARMRIALGTDDDFRKWLRTPQELLQDKTPLELIAKGKWQTMADFVDDALTGAPT